jgi:hypothetical protein
LAIVIEPYQERHEAAVDDFNRRLQAGGADKDLVFYRWAKPRFLPHSDGASLYNEYFVALEGGAVRGGYALKYQDFLCPDGNIRSLGYYHHPLSEGIVNKAYAVVGSLLLRDALQRSPLLYCLGMGGYGRPLPKMLVSLGWTHCLVPFYFKILNPSKFLREMQAIRTSRVRSLLMDIGAFSGAGSTALKFWNVFTRMRGPSFEHDFQAEVMEGFSDWADSLWEASQQLYSLTAIRDAGTLRLLYPAADRHFTRLRVKRNSQDLGWTVVGEKREDPKYGSMRVGSIVDCCAIVSEERSVIRAATDSLRRQGFDLIVSNQRHQNWCRALEAEGFLNAQSNFIFAASKKLAGLLQPFEDVQPRMHFTRADGDGLPRNF